MKTHVTLTLLLTPLLFAACASAPTGPSIAALPGTGKSFEQFRYDDFKCREFAQHQINPDAANNSGLRSAAVGTVIGTVAGAAIGGHDGAAVGAGTGLMMGSVVGTGVAQETAYSTQKQYDNAYVQCMYGKGQRVPVDGTVVQSRPQQVAPAAPAPNYPPPPPGWRP